jgi:hypothetical protein
MDFATDKKNMYVSESHEKEVKKSYSNNNLRPDSSVYGSFIEVRYNQMKPTS